MGLPANWQGNACLPPTGWDNEIGRLGWPPAGQAPVTVFRPPNGGFVGDLELDFDAATCSFSMPGNHGRWQVHELDLASGETRQLPLIDHPQVDNYDACYLPDGGIIFSSTAPFQGVPCVRGVIPRRQPLSAGPRRHRAIRQLTFDQDHNWWPTVLPTTAA